MLCCFLVTKRDDDNLLLPCALMEIGLLFLLQHVGLLVLSWIIIIVICMFFFARLVIIIIIIVGVGIGCESGVLESAEKWQKGRSH